jgi:long-chain acyl-CoA synthetase
LATWMKLHDLTFTTPQEAIANPRVIAKFQEIIDTLNPQFNHVEQIKKFELLPTEWSVDGGEMTPKLSVKRKVVMEKYKQYVEKIYKN